VTTSYMAMVRELTCCGGASDCIAAGHV
jgi:hypothetical protein